MALGKRFNEVSCSSSEINFVKTLLEAIRLLGVLNISDIFPSLEWMDLQVSVVSPNIEEYRKINLTLSLMSTYILSLLSLINLTLSLLGKSLL